jgi:hypothetical protein
VRERLGARGTYPPPQSLRLEYSLRQNSHLARHQSAIYVAYLRLNSGLLLSDKQIMRNMRRYYLAAGIFMLSGCALDSPGEQCLESFRLTLKDPDSGKVISYSGNALTYSATNGYGARIQGRALCKKDGDKWMRDLHSELLATLELTARRLDENNKCLAAGKDARSCGGGSLAIKYAAERNISIDLNALQAEASKELGFD